jgi:hypothetical protein
VLSVLVVKLLILLLVLELLSSLASFIPREDVEILMRRDTVCVVTCVLMTMEMTQLS